MEPQRLRDVPIFAELSDHDLAQLADLADLLTLGPNKVLTFQEEYAFKFFVILDGVVSVWQDGQQIGELGRGDFFGEIGLESQKRTATVTTDADTEFAVFMEWDLHMFRERWPSVADRISEKLQQRLQADHERQQHADPGRGG